jgi:cell division control protein 6
MSNKKIYMNDLKPLMSDETIFSNIDSLEQNFIPKILPHRENEQKQLTEIILPVSRGISGKNALVLGNTGIGKTHATKRVIEDFTEKFSQTSVSFVNCWSFQDSREIISRVCSNLGFSLTQNLSTNQLIEKIIQLQENKKGLILVFDEIDKAKDFQFLYTFLEEIESKSIILISNNVEWFAFLDQRIRSRLQPQTILFKDYDLSETRDILNERRKIAFFENTWEKNAFELIVKKTFNLGDIRIGLKLLKEAGLTAEKEASRIVTEKHAIKAIKSLNY